MLHLAHLALVVRQVDSAIHWINHYPADSVVYYIRWIVIYMVDSFTQTSTDFGPDMYDKL